jgi:protein-tyrosine phosphatase
MIDLHSHVLPGLDDGASELVGSVAMAREAAAAGITALAGTPHVRDDYPTTASQMRGALGTVRAAVREHGIDIEILPGAEIAIDELSSLDDDELGAFGLGGSPNHLLIELPFFGWPLDTADRLRRLREVGFTAVLAHPERNSVVQDSPQQLADLVSAGALVQLTAASITGDFGPAAARSSRTLLSAGLAHLVATDSHRARGRGLSLGPALDSLRDPALVRWLTKDVPAAIVEGSRYPQRPAGRAGWLTKRLHRGTPAARPAILRKTV